MTFLSTDKIKIFVSSTLTECADERRLAGEAVISVNREPIMFEAAGARPYAPRSVYLRGIEDSHIFVGIYKEQYGYIAEDMDISGLEDEYRYATSVGIPRLLYTKRHCNREMRLEQLVSEMKGPDITVGSYDTENDLFDRIRDDITALVDNYFLTKIRKESLSPTAPRDIAEQLAPTHTRIQRSTLQAALLDQLAKGPLLIVHGPLGAGKTVLLATMAEHHGWTFVQCGERLPREVIAEVTNGLRGKIGLPETPYATSHQAISAFRAAWEASRSITLVLDDVRTLQTVSAILDSVEVSSNKRVILSTREEFSINNASRLSIPPFDKEEVAEFVAKNRPQPLTSTELDNLIRAAAGNPLYLRYYVSGEPGRFETSLKEYELALWEHLKPRSHEALSYLAISPRSLQLDQLFDLMAAESGSIEEIAHDLAAAKSLISESSNGYSIFHPHAKETIREIVRNSPQRWLFYSRRLARWYEKKRNYTSAFLVLEDAGLEIPQQLLRHSARHAALQGDVSSASKILQRQIAEAKKIGDVNSARDSLVWLAQMLGFAGKLDEALAALDEAESLNTSRDSLIPVKEIRLSTLVWVRGDSEAFAELAALKSTYIDNGREWDAARIAVELSAAFIRRADYRNAAKEAEFARDIFDKYHDGYGSTTAKFNLLSALSGIPGNDDAVNKLMQELSDDSANQPRRRAAFCNVLARKARENNDVAASKAYANEAIEIGHSLGDVSVICINQAILGNAFKQEGNFDGALEQYRLADKTAQEAGLTQLEGWIQRLIASVLNRKGDGNLAIHHARYAIGLLKDRSSWRTEADAYEELAYGCEQIRDWLGARDGWLHVAELKLHRLEDEDEGSYAFLRAARLLQKDNAREPYIDAYQKLFKDRFESDARLSSREKLVIDMPILLQSMPDQFAFEAAVYHGRLVFDGLPQVVARQFYIRLFNGIIKMIGKHQDIKRLVLAALAVSMVVPCESLSIGDLALLSKELAESIPALSFRAHQDGAAHWALRIQLSKPVIITISQLDDRKDVALVPLCLALMLLAFSKELEEDVLAGAEPSRSEANIQIVEFEEAKQNVRLEKVGLDKMEQECVVTRAVDPKLDPTLPIVIITRRDLTSSWFVGEGRSNAGQLLFAKTLVELVYHLFAGEIELESLYPKLVELVKKTLV
jgi:hypothetical protein